MRLISLAGLRFPVSGFAPLSALSGFALLAVALCAGGCSAPKRSAIHYSPPSVHPVREKIADAQTHATAQGIAARGAKVAIDKAIELLGSARVVSENVPELQESLAEASGQVNQFMTANAGLQSALGEATARIDLLQETIGKQTTQLNTANTEKNAALDARDAVIKQSARVEKKYHRLKFAVCTLAAAIATFLAIKLGLLKLLSFLGPYGMLGIAAVPIAVFGALWFLL